MKKLRKYDEMELMIHLKACRLCYVILTGIIVLWNIIDIFTLPTEQLLETPQFTIMELMIVLDILAVAIYTPTMKKKEKKKNEK